MALNHTVQGSNTYTVVGSPTIVDGVVSGFSVNDYLTLPQISTQSINTLESVIKVKVTSDDLLGDNYIIQGSAGNLSLRLQSSGSGTRRLRLTYKDSNNTSYGINSNTQLQLGNIYYIKFVLTSGLQSLYLSNDGISYNLENTNNASTVSYTDTTYILGANGSNSEPNRIWAGSIDLNNTYIKVNGQAWFGVCPVEVKHINYGTTVGYDKVGSPTISNGVVSNFSASDYIKTSSVITGKVSNYEFNTKVTFGAISGGRRYILGYATNDSLCGLQINANYKLSWMSTRWSGGGNVEIISPIDPVEGSTYLINCSYVGNGTFKLKVSNDNGTTWSEATGTLPEGVTEPTLSAGIRLGRSEGTGNAYIFNGSIDLNYTKFKKNGELWFYQPCTNYLVKDGKLVFADSGLYLSGPVNYTTVGSPTIVNGVASNFSSSNYLTVSQNLPTSIQNFEICLKYSNWTSGRIVRYSTEGAGRAYELRTYGDYFRFDGPSAFYVSNKKMTDYSYVKAIATNNFATVQMFVSNNGQTWEEATLTATEETHLVGGIPILGYSLSSTTEIDLNQTYIKVNSDLWFYGKNYASQNIAPVPSGLPYGTTTTNAIGWVDMRTQVFTAAPSGATLGKDE